MWWLLLAFSCGSKPADSLGQEGAAVRDQLAQALVARDPSVVTGAARAAAKWEGKDPALDRLMGDALANVLMKPEEGLKLLQAWPDPEDEAWRRATLDAAARTGTPDTIAAVWAQLGRAPIASQHAVVQQFVQRARKDPKLGHAVLEDVVGRCVLLDSQPHVGREVMDLPASAELVPAARALGAHGVALGRAVRRTDPDPSSGAGPWRCARRMLIETSWPEPMPRSMVIGATDGHSQVYLDIKLQAEGPWAYAASDSQAGARWLQAARLYKEAGGGQAGTAKVQEVLGSGLMP